MCNSKIILFFLCSLIFNCEAQNYVSNPSFETYNTCPNNGAQIYFSNGWYQPVKYLGLSVNQCSSSEYYNTCTLNSSIFVPANQGGFQYAKSGFGYAGIALAVPESDYQEYIATSLTDTLTNGKNYFVSFFISLADSSSISTSCVGAFFSKDTIF